MSDHRLQIRRVAVLGAGVMGAHIAAYLVNAGVPAMLYDLRAREGPRNGLVLTALDVMSQLEPAPLAARDRIVHIRASNYDDGLPQLAQCHLVMEAIAERLDWKRDLYAKIAPHLALDAATRVTEEPS
jgi:3-hydroxyacyl-CoA dehydrogenase